MQNPITSDPRFQAAMLMIQLGQEKAEHIKTEFQLEAALARIVELEEKINDKSVDSAVNDSE